MVRGQGREFVGDSDHTPVEELKGATPQKIIDIFETTLEELLLETIPEAFLLSGTSHLPVVIGNENKDKLKEVYDGVIDVLDQKCPGALEVWVNANRDGFPRMPGAKGVVERFKERQASED